MRERYTGIENGGKEYGKEIGGVFYGQRRAAEALAAAAGADLVEIAPVEAYTAADLDWRDEHSRSTLEHKDAASRPAIRQAANTDGYDTIFLGFPIWWYTAPQIIRTYLESGDFAGKTVVPFATSGGSELGGTVEDLRPSAPAANWKPGRMLNGRLDAAELKAWAEEQ